MRVFTAFGQLLSIITLATGVVACFLKTPLTLEAQWEKYLRENRAIYQEVVAIDNLITDKWRAGEPPEEVIARLDMVHNKYFRLKTESEAWLKKLQVVSTIKYPPFKDNIRGKIESITAGVEVGNGQLAMTMSGFTDIILTWRLYQHPPKTAVK